MTAVGISHPFETGVPKDDGTFEHCFRHTNINGVENYYSSLIFHPIETGLKKTDCQNDFSSLWWWDGKKSRYSICRKDSQLTPAVKVLQYIWRLAEIIYMDWVTPCLISNLKSSTGIRFYKKHRLNIDFFS